MGGATSGINKQAHAVESILLYSDERYLHTFPMTIYGVGYEELAS